MKDFNMKRVRVNISLQGKPMEILLSLKSRGIITSNSDGVVQGLYALHERVIKNDILEAKLKNLNDAIVHDVTK